MDRTTYVVLKNAGFYNIVDRSRLEKLKNNVVPVVREKIDFLLQNDSTPFGTVQDPFWGIDITRFTHRFTTASSPRDRLDEVVVTFLLFQANLVAQVKISRTFVQHGAWESEWAWQEMFKWITYSAFTLLYDVRVWTPEFFLHLDELVVELVVGGRPSALRKFARKLGVSFEPLEPLPAETHFTKLDYHSTVVFGPYYWRMLHWMAEAFATRETRGDGGGGGDHRREELEHSKGKLTETNPVTFAKKLWREFVTDALYRTLRCGLCMHDYHEMLTRKGWKEKILQSSDVDFPTIWYQVHNEVNRKNQKPIYSLENWKRDRKFMREALDTSHSHSTTNS